MTHVRGLLTKERLVEALDPALHSQLMQAFAERRITNTQYKERLSRLIDVAGAKILTEHLTAHPDDVEAKQAWAVLCSRAFGEQAFHEAVNKVSSPSTPPLPYAPQRQTTS